MDYSSHLDDALPKEDKLLAFGFRKKDESWVFEMPSSDPSFDFALYLTSNRLDLELLDKETRDPYVPFNVEGVVGSLVASLREEGNALIDRVLQECCTSLSRRNEIVSYAKSRYHAWVDHPFPGDDDTIVIRPEQGGKWIGLIMHIPTDRLLKHAKGNSDVINLKLPSEEIPSLCDGKTIFPAYHMSKKYWVTAILSKDVPLEKFEHFIDESYGLVAPKAKRAKSMKAKRKE